MDASTGARHVPEGDLGGCHQAGEGVAWEVGQDRADDLSLRLALEQWLGGLKGSRLLLYCCICSTGAMMLDVYLL